MNYSEYYLKQRDLIKSIEGVKIYQDHYGINYRDSVIEEMYAKSGWRVGGEVEAFYRNCAPPALAWGAGEGTKVYSDMFSSRPLQI